MARIDDVFITGTLGNVVLYRRMGKPCARIKRGHIRQTGATKKRGINFGIAAKSGKGLRAGLTPVMPNPTDRSMQSRFSGAIAKWLGQSDVNSLQPCDKIPFVSSFHITEGGTFLERFKVPVSVSLITNGVRVNLVSFIPVRNISAPGGTLSIRLIIAVAAAKLSTGTAAGRGEQTIEIPYNDIEIPARFLDFAVPADEGNIIVTAARLIYFGLKNNQQGIIDKKGFNPVGVINAAYY
jgi:hypothetical protein